jgi:hypothetical protein
MSDQAQGQVGADRAVGRPGPAARMAGTQSERPRPSVLIPPVTAQPGPDATGSSSRSAPAESKPAPAPKQQAPAPAAPKQTRPSEAPPQAPRAPHPPSGGAQTQSGRSAAPQAPQEPAAKSRADKRAEKKARKEAEQASRAQGAAASVARAAVQPDAGPRSARLYLTHIDPWSVMKQAFLLSLALAVVILVAFAALWFALDSAGVLDAITRTATDVGGASGATVGDFLAFSRVMGAGLVIAGIETVLVTVMCTLFAFLYNLAVGIGGGLEVTFSEED